MVMHFEVDGETILKDSEDAKVQEEIKEERDGFINTTVKEHELADFNGDFDMKVAVKILRNKFNYSERQSQTTNP